MRSGSAPPRVQVSPAKDRKHPVFRLVRRSASASSSRFACAEEQRDSAPSTNNVEKAWERLCNFTVLQPTEAEQVSKEGSIRKWIEGQGQMVRWAGSIVQLLQQNEDRQWGEAKILGRDMKGMLPRGWALEFSGGKVVES